MKKLLTMTVAVLLVSGVAFAGDKKEKEGKSCSKSCHKEKKEKVEKPAAEEKKG
jgi:hypothetical protein